MCHSVSTQCPHVRQSNKHELSLMRYHPLGHWMFQMSGWWKEMSLKMMSFSISFSHLKDVFYEYFLSLVNNVWIFVNVFIAWSGYKCYRLYSRYSLVRMHISYNIFNIFRFNIQIYLIFFSISFWLETRLKKRLSNRFKSGHVTNIISQQFSRRDGFHFRLHLLFPVVVQIMSKSIHDSYKKYILQEKF